MRRISITSVLMMLVLGTSASACVSGWGTVSASSCHRPGRQQSRALTRSVNSTAVGPACGPILQAATGRCGLRNWVQFQFVAFRKFDIYASLPLAERNIPPALDSALIVTSVGSPETDRGPPCS